jgi:transcriptional regulator with XRE-family HTH domain
MLIHLNKKEVEIMKFNEKLKLLREERDMSLSEFANLLGTSKQVISRYERGENTPKITTVSRFASILGVSLAYLMNENVTDRREPTFADKKTTPEELSLSEGEKMLLDLFRQVPETQQQLVLQMISVALKTKE